MLSESSQLETIQALRGQLREWCASPRLTFSSGVDYLFPGGFQRGTLIEYLADDGSGAMLLSFLAAREACRDGRALIVIDREQRIYPPALAGRAVDMANTIIIRPRTKKDQLWSLCQSLGCPGVGAVLCPIERLDSRAFRAFQLAAEKGRAVGLFIRPTNVRGQPTWSEVQLLVKSLPGNKVRRLQIEVVRSRNGNRKTAIVEIDDESPIPSAVRVVSELADAANTIRSTGT